MSKRQGFSVLLYVVLLVTAPVLWGWSGLWADGALFLFSVMTGDTWSIIQGRDPWARKGESDRLPAPSWKGRDEN